MVRGVLAAILVVLLAAAARARTPEKLQRAQRRMLELLRSEGLEAPPRDLRVLVHKAERRLELVARLPGSKEPKVLLACPIGLGGAPEGHKQREGDLRTPEGSYYVCTRNERSRFHLFLGLSYPGLADADQGLSEGRITEAEHRSIGEAIRGRRRPPWNTDLGGEIGIHGFGAGSDWTLGCVAVDDDRIETLWALCPLGTPVEIRP
jgi:murein L,D-transpeptidase YafK